ncbi:hypothetical protein ACWEVD_28540 [Nocardia thailandica]
MNEITQGAVTVLPMLACVAGAVARRGVRVSEGNSLLPAAGIGIDAIILGTVAHDVLTTDVIGPAARSWVVGVVLMVFVSCLVIVFVGVSTHHRSDRSGPGQELSKRCGPRTQGRPNLYGGS